MNPPNHFNRQFIVQFQGTLQAKDYKDAKRRAADALKDGLIEPGFLVDGAVSDAEPIELTVE